MGRAGPAQLTGPDSAQKGLGRDWADLGPPKSPIFVWAGPGPDSRDEPESVWPTNTWLGQNQSGPEKKKTNNAGPESAWPSNITSGGELFSPSPPACRTLFVLHAGENHESTTIRGEKSYLAWRRWCVAGLAASLVVLRWRPVAVLWLTGGGSKQRCCCSSGEEREISSSSPLLWFFSFFLSLFRLPVVVVD